MGENGQSFIKGKQKSLWDQTVGSISFLESDRYRLGHPSVRYFSKYGLNVQSGHCNLCSFKESNAYVIRLIEN